MVDGQSGNLMMYTMDGIWRLSSSSFVFELYELQSGPWVFLYPQEPDDQNLAGGNAMFYYGDGVPTFVFSPIDENSWQYSIVAVSYQYGS